MPGDILLTSQRYSPDALNGKKAKILKNPSEISKFCHEMEMPLKGPYLASSTGRSCEFHLAKTVRISYSQVR